MQQEVLKTRRKFLLLSSLRKLSPILVVGILRVGGRLEFAPILFDAKYPMILPAHNHVSSLLISYYHERSGHVGPSHVLSSMCKMFWIIAGHSHVQHVLGKCKGQNLPLKSQLMALQMVTPGGYAFNHVGLDYFGPFYVKQGRARIKRYGCIFTCMNMSRPH
jgi:hypothetical protein